MFLPRSLGEVSRISLANFGAYLNEFKEALGLEMLYAFGSHAPISLESKTAFIEFPLVRDKSVSGVEGEVQKVMGTI
jgi:hypothetical protein